MIERKSISNTLKWIKNLIFLMGSVAAIITAYIAVENHNTNKNNSPFEVKVVTKTDSSSMVNDAQIISQISRIESELIKGIKEIVLYPNELNKIKLDSMIKFNSINSIRVGMTNTEFKRLIYQSESYYPFNDSINNANVIVVSDVKMGEVLCYSKDEYKTIHMVTTSSPKYKTTNGIHVDMTISDYLFEYPSTERLYIGDTEDILFFLPRDLNMMSNSEGLFFMVEVKVHDRSEIDKIGIKKDPFEGEFYEISEYTGKIIGKINKISIYAPGTIGTPIFRYKYPKFN